MISRSTKYVTYSCTVEELTEMKRREFNRKRNMKLQNQNKVGELKVYISLQSMHRVIFLANFSLLLSVLDTDVNYQARPE